ncbi:MAG TPA: SDR family oxidoreductase [Ilumatobacter sp.]|nr:SDR family oxidoreductase [Ilumatobacter sp.]
MDLGIAGKIALVAGGSAGLGGASALALAQEGADLYISARGSERLEAAAADIRLATGATVTPIVSDHGTEQGRQQLYSVCPAPDIVVITFSPPPLTDDFRAVVPDQWRTVLESMVVGSIELMRHYSQGMADRGSGRIVNIGTIAAKYPMASRALSGASRAAVTNYAVGLSKVVARHGVVVNSLLPGIFETPGLTTTFVDAAAANGTTEYEERQRFLGRFNIPARRYGSPEELGAWCAMLCSRQASYLTGQSVGVDGGLGGGLF